MCWPRFRANPPDKAYRLNKTYSYHKPGRGSPAPGDNFSSRAADHAGAENPARPEAVPPGWPRHSCEFEFGLFRSAGGHSKDMRSSLKALQHFGQFDVGVSSLTTLSRIWLRYFWAEPHFPTSCGMHLSSREHFLHRLSNLAGGVTPACTR